MCIVFFSCALNMFWTSMDSLSKSTCNRKCMYEKKKWLCCVRILRMKTTRINMSHLLCREMFNRHGKMLSITSFCCIKAQKQNKYAREHTCDVHVQNSASYSELCVQQIESLNVFCLCTEHICSCIFTWRYFSHDYWLLYECDKMKWNRNTAQKKYVSTDIHYTVVAATAS